MKLFINNYIVKLKNIINLAYEYVALYFFIFYFLFNFIIHLTGLHHQVHKISLQPTLFRYI